MDSAVRSRGQLRRLAREQANDTARLLEVYQRENESLKADLAAAYAFIFAVVGYDYVDTGNGRVILAVGPYPEDEGELYG